MTDKIINFLSSKRTWNTILLLIFFWSAAAIYKIGFLVGYYLYILLVCTAFFARLNCNELEDPFSGRFKIRQRNQILAAFLTLLFSCLLSLHLIFFGSREEREIFFHTKEFSYGEKKISNEALRTNWGLGTQNSIKKKIRTVAFCISEYCQEPFHYAEEKSFVINKFSTNSDHLLAVFYLEDQQDQESQKSPFVMTIESGKTEKITIPFKAMGLRDKNQTQVKHLKMNFTEIDFLDLLIIKIYTKLHLNDYVISAYSTLK